MDSLINLFNSVLPLSAEEQLLMKEHLYTEKIKKGDLYCERGKTCKKIGFVLDGVFKVVRSDSNDNDFILYFTSENHFAVDIESFTNKTPAEEYIEALTPCTVVTMTISTYELLGKEIPNFTQIISQLKEKALIEKFRIKSEMFVDDAQTKYNKLLQRHPSIIQRVPQNHIASFLGITQYTLSRIKARK